MLLNIYIIFPWNTTAHAAPQFYITIQQLAKESEIMARKKLLEGPEERAKTRKKERKDQKIVRVVKKVPITFYTCNASHITNKMPILAHDVGKHKSM